MTVQSRFITNKSRSYSASPRPSTGWPGSPGGGYRTPPTPANQNWRGPPSAANDNYPKPSTPNGFKMPRGMTRLIYRFMPAAVAAYGLYKLYELWANANGAQQWYAPAGYQEMLNCGGSDGVKWGRNAETCNNSITIANMTPLIDIPRVVGGIGVNRYWWNMGQITGSRYYTKKAYMLEVPTSGAYVSPRDDPKWIAPAALPSPFNQPFIPPHIMPEMDPLALPIHQPLPSPRPLPRTFPRPNVIPGRSPQESTNRGPRPRARPRPDGTLNPRTLPGVVPVTFSGSHTIKPPPKGEKHKKWSAGYAGSKAAKVFNAVTEANDVVNALWDQIPEHLRSDCAKNAMICKAKDIYKFGEHINMAEAINALNEENLHDRLHGSAMGKVNKAVVGAGLNPGAVNFR